MLFFLTVPLYIRWGQFIIFQVTLTRPSHQVTSNFMLVLKRLHLNLLNIVILFILKVVLRYHPTILKTIQTIKVNPQRNRYIVFPAFCDLSKHNISQIIHQQFF